MHPGLLANGPLRRLDPLARPTLQRLAAQKTHLFDEPLLGRVLLCEVPVQVPHRDRYRGHSVAKTRMRLKKRRKRFVAESRCHHGADSLDCRSASLLPTTSNRTPRGVTQLRADQLSEMDRERLRQLTREELEELTWQLVEVARSLSGKVKQNSTNSSRPPSSDDP